MLAPEEKLKFGTKPYLAVTARFANGADTPRDFFERVSPISLRLLDTSAWRLWYAHLAPIIRESWRLAM
jgi:hypothetical protein